MLIVSGGTISEMTGDSVRGYIRMWRFMTDKRIEDPYTVPYETWWFLCLYLQGSSVLML